MYALKTKGRIVAKANREFLGNLLFAFNICPPDLTLVNPQGRVVLTAKIAAPMTHAPRWEELSAREQVLYEEAVAKHNLRKSAQALLNDRAEIGGYL